MNNNIKLAKSADFPQISRIKGSPTSETPVSLRDFLNLVFKRKIQIFLVFCAVVLLITVINLRTIPIYLATAKILVKTERENVNMPAKASRLPGEMQINSEIEILNNRSLSEKTLAALGPETIYPKSNPQDQDFLKKYHRKIKDEIKALLGKYFPQKREPTPSVDNQASEVLAALAQFQGALSVWPIKDTNLIKVQFIHENPEIAATVVNTLAEIYLDHHLTVYKTPKFNKFIQQQTELLKNKLQQSEKKLEFLKEQHNITSLNEERSLMLKEEAALRADLNRTLSLEVETGKRIHQLKQQLLATPKTIQKSEAVNQNQNLINSLEVKLVELELKEMELRKKYTDEMHEVRNVKEEIQAVRERLAEEVKRRWVTSASGPNPSYQGMQAELSRYENDIKALKAKIEILKVQLADFQIKLHKLNRIEIELTQLQQEIDVDRRNYQLYLAKFEESRISDAMDSEKITSVSLIEPARPPLYPENLRGMRNFLLAILLGVFAALGIAFFFHYLDDSLETVEDVEEFLELPVLASIPELKN